jgi:two-component system sensor histidine kinase FlrB
MYSNKNSVYISVKDNGPGINSADIEKIFEPFYTSSSQGTGRGLAVVKSVVEAPQGEVNYLSKEGEGANFCLKLPLLGQIEASSINKTSIQEKQNEPS